MEYKGRRQSGNVLDKRGGAAAGVGGFTLIIALIYAFVFGDMSMLFNVGLDMALSKNVNNQFVESAAEKEMAEFVSVVLADTEDVWHTIFKENNMTYKEPKMILFKNRVNSGCGIASSDTGPFYCPADMSIYIDLSFHQQLKTQFKATGDFAMAYVVAHEVGHHVQTLLGTSQKVNSYYGKVSEKDYNQLLKRLELQADYYAGVWIHHQKNKNLLGINDIEEALVAASAIGDDKIQEMSQGYVVPDKFTHGTSKQRVKWLKLGYQYGTLADGNTFALSEEELFRLNYYMY